MEKEITVVERVEELAIVSGTAFEFEVQELTKLSEKSKDITSTDHKDYKEVKSEMVKKRNYIKQYCLDARRDIKKAASGVTGVEDALYDIFVPDENRMIEISKKEKHDKEMELRKAVLPERKEKLATLKDDVEVTDEFLLDMDGSAFQGYFNQRLADKNEADRAEIARVQAEQDEKEQALENEKKAQEREEQARKEERERIEREQQEKIEREAREKLEAEQKEKERIAQEEKDEAEKKAKRERADRYKAFRAEHGYTEETRAEYWEDVKGDTVTLYKKVGTFDLTELK